MDISLIDSAIASGHEMWNAHGGCNKPAKDTISMIYTYPPKLLT